MIMSDRIPTILLVFLSLLSSRVSVMNGEFLESTALEDGETPVLHHRGTKVTHSNDSVAEVTSGTPGDETSHRPRDSDEGEEQKDANESDEANQSETRKVVLPKDCGRVYKGKKNKNRIAGGYSAKKGEFPSYVFLQSNYDFPRLSESCGGVIISNYHILTAGHCVKDATGIQVSPKWNKKDRGKVFAAKRWCPSPRYTAENLDYDFAIVKLESPIQFNKEIQPACLPEKPVKPAQRAKSVGLGLIDLHHGRDKRPDILQVLPVQQILCSQENMASYRICFRSWNEKYKGDSCAGDSGGPIFLEGADRATVVGLTSYGPDICKKGVINTSINTDVFKVRSGIMDLIEKCQ